jgi:uncharacterized membrane protein YozB (DUF420 family)
MKLLKAHKPYVYGTMLTQNMEFWGDLILTTAFTTSDLHDWMQYANITVQITILLLIAASLILKKKQNYTLHGNIMLLAVIMNAVALLAHMGPSIIWLPNEPLFVTVLGVIHLMIGTITEALGIWITIPWGFGNSETRSCAKKRKHMRKTMILWMIAFGIGIIFYMFHTLFE